MKNLLFAIAVALGSTVIWANEEPKTKQVCIDIKDKDGKPVKNKDGTTKQQCKEMKIHKKHEGTEIPPKK